MMPTIDMSDRSLVNVDWRGMFCGLTDEEYAAVFEGELEQYGDLEDGFYYLQKEDLEDFIIRYHMSLNKKRHEKFLQQQGGE